VDFDPCLRASGDCCYNFVPAVIEEYQVFANIKAQHIPNLVRNFPRERDETEPGIPCMCHYISRLLLR
jgi:hypothetical protein